MKTLPIHNRRRMKQFWPGLLAALGCLMVAAASAQETSSVSNAGHPVITTSANPTNQIPTYLGDIQPIFMGNCSRCHNQQSRFIYDWLDYKTAYADRWEIRRRIWDSVKGTYYKEAMPVANSPESTALSDEDRQAILKWVDNGAPRGVAPPPGTAKTRTERIAAGKRLFTSICAACHQPTGQGRANLFPPLAGSDYLNADKDRAIRIVIFGRQGEVVVNGMKFNNNMPAFPLSDDNIANVLTFVYNSFGNSGFEVSPEAVKILRSQPPAPSTAPAVKSIFE